MRREPDPSDGRAWVVGMTPRGRRTYNRVRGDTDDFWVRLLSGLDAQERDAFLHALDKVAEVMSENVAPPID